MKKLVLIIMGLSTLVGCEEVFKGQLSLEKDIQFSTPLSRQEMRLDKRCKRRRYRSSECRRLKKKIENSNKLIAAGDHRAKLIPGKSKVKMKILNHKGKTVQEFAIKVPKKVKLPRKNGSIKLDAADTGFPYDIKGELGTVVTDSDTQYGSDSCTWEEPHRVCKRVLEPIPGCVPGENGGKADRPGRGKKKRKNCMRRVRKCHTEYITYHGYQNVEFFHRHTQKDIVFSMIKPESREMIGEFDGTYNNREKIYTYRGICR